ncbi:MAG: OsmC family peroxiredoxin [Proteobacteria bacterium]|nr:OsmC family peroxiredoxin [Pseudomonadota bacterium]
MVMMHGRYLGGKNIEIAHGPSGATIRTAAPKDNHGEGNLFSPTDLVAAAMGSCILTTMAIVAERDKTDLTGAYFDVEKKMSLEPRRIGALPIVVHLPRALSETQRKKMENSARACPVHHSLHPDMQKEISFIYDIG